jgi:hypothetical protein
LKKLFLYITIIPKLGWCNVFYNIWYRISLRPGIRRFFFPLRVLPYSSDFFGAGPLRQDYPSQLRERLIADADKIISGHLKYYSRHWMKTGNPPDWFLNPFNGIHNPDSKKHWTQVSEFGTKAGDIKNIWEASRFEWLVTLARAFSVTGEGRYLETVNAWLKDWALKNPLNTGPNWRCGQEASVRVFNLILTADILEPSESLRDLVYAHLERISGNICYAVSQDNNHGTSEAAGLFIGGSWLASVDGGRYSRAAKFAAKGRKWLENRVEKLVAADGGFSQHSVNYHRVLIDTLTFAEYFRKKCGQEPFSGLFYERAKAAFNWLYQLTDEASGGAPNLGANDGSLINHLHQSSYKDFRPSLQLTAAIFSGRRLFPAGDADEPLYWLNETCNELKTAGPPKGSLVYNSGYVVLRNNGSWCLLRFPRFRFRPSHNDVFHFDLWYKGVNVLCDAGSYSYNPSGEFAGLNLKSVRFHNTVAFDGGEQMPELTRFLMGKWIKPDNTGEILKDANGEFSWEGSYTDQAGNVHTRRVSVKDKTWVLKDTLSGNFRYAEIGFNINDTECSLSGSIISASFGTVILPEDAKVVLGDTYISEHYNELRQVKRVKATVVSPGTYFTVIQLNS